MPDAPLSVEHLRDEAMASLYVLVLFVFVGSYCFKAKHHNRVEQYAPGWQGRYAPIGILSVWPGKIRFGSVMTSGFALTIS
jgi:hypothetical protein